MQCTSSDRIYGRDAIGWLAGGGSRQHRSPARTYAHMCAIGEVPGFELSIVETLIREASPPSSKEKN
ncbi:hypothetical protein TcWFU_001196 [Taenia crassiceps]|uniref:Uncharacterized protein n=1 Tax=Taenia crassiceps TaxID=6207 RepID=A0ABR4QJT2_9CEST